MRAAQDDPALFDDTLARLTESRLLTLSGEEEEKAAVDLSHEALIDGWPALRGWVDERREAEQVRRGLEDKAAEWVRLGQERGGLLDEIELVEAERWLTSPDAADLGYGKELPELIDASCAAQEAEARETARAEAVARGAAEVEARNAEATAIAERDITDEQRRIALARQLAAQAELERSRAGGSWNLAGLLAVESLRRRSDAVEAVAVLYRVLGRRGFPVSWLEHDDWVYSVAFSLDGQRVATASRDHTAQVWEAATGAKVARLEHGAAVRSVAFSPDGRWLATASGDGTAQVWVAPATLTETMCQYLTRNLTQDEWQCYIGEEPYRCTCPNLPPGEGAPLEACSSTISQSSP